MGLMGNGEGHTLLILTDEESRLIRGAVAAWTVGGGREMGDAPLRAWARGVERGTAKLKQEAADGAKRKRERKR